MNYDELMAALYQVQHAREITLKGRRESILSCSIPDGPVPDGWRRIGESRMQHIDGYMRIRLVK